MKRVYKKPYIRFEDFSLSENIALGCEVKANHAKDACSITDNGYSVFANISICTDYQFDPDTDEYVNNDGEKVCYHIPLPDNNVFTS